MKQEGGDNSTNIQVKGDYNNGLSYSDARQVALDVFKANYYDLTEEAMNTVNARLGCITDNIIEKVYTELADKVDRLKEPSIQSTIIDIQKEYVKTGDDILGNQLTVMLTERIKAEDRTLKQIAIDEAIKILPKLTNQQIDLLSLHMSILFLFDLCQINSTTKFKDSFNTEILSFCHSGIVYSDIMHLQSCGCLTLLSEGSTFKPFEELLGLRYTGLFNRGFTEEEFKKDVSEDILAFKGIFTRCQQDASKLQFNGLSADYFDNLLKSNHINSPYKENIIKLNNNRKMTKDEIKHYVISSIDGAKLFFDIWTDSKIRANFLTPVGVVIALMNYNIKKNKNLPLDPWIKLSM